jgi:ribosomal 50S subunit-recycling heat shock protein
MKRRKIAAELVDANSGTFQNEEKKNRCGELVVANTELAFKIKKKKIEWQN